jgi:hypothetical protein
MVENKKALDVQAEVFKSLGDVRRGEFWQGG